MSKKKMKEKNWTAFCKYWQGWQAGYCCLSRLVVVDHVHLSSALFGFECPLGSSLFLINCFEVGLPQVHFESGPLLALPRQYHQEPLVHVFPLLSSIICCHLTTKGSNEAFVMFQKLKCNQAPALGIKCHITLTSVCCLSVSLGSKGRRQQ